MDKLPVILYVADVGVEGRWHYLSLGVEAILGFSPQEWMDDPGLWSRQMHPDDRRRVFEREDELVAPTIPDEYRMLGRDGRVVWVRDEAALVNDGHGGARWHGVISDITDRKLAEAELERRAEQQAAVARLGEHALQGEDVATLMREALEEGARIVGVEMGAVLQEEPDSGRLILRAGVDLSRTEQLEQLQRRAGWLDPLDPRAGIAADPQRPDAQRAEPGAGMHPAASLPVGVTGHIEGRNGRWGLFWLGNAGESEVGPADADFVQALANILADAIQQRATEASIRYQAVHDPLTGLPNRALFLDRLASALHRPRARGGGGAARRRQLQARQRQPRPRRGR